MPAANQDFTQLLAQHSLHPLRPRRLRTLQLNITKLCNQACVHCHVDASPRRREMMPPAVMDACLAILAQHASIESVDITGGAPELHPDFNKLVAAARDLGKHVMVRHNLTVTVDLHPLQKTSMAYLPEFFRDHQVEVISSLPCYTELLTDKQRGAGVFHKSLESLRLLNAVGYGLPDSNLRLNLVYNPSGAFLPGSQTQLEQAYKKVLAEQFDLHFHTLYTMTNMPIHRFKAQLVKSGEYHAYMDKLAAAFNPQAATGVMCRDLISVAYDGRLYDCDFNQMLGLSLECGNAHADKPCSVFDFDLASLSQRSIRFATHCLGCTAGAGSSCGGSLATRDTFNTNALGRDARV